MENTEIQKRKLQIVVYNIYGMFYVDIYMSTNAHLSKFAGTRLKCKQTKRIKLFRT